MAQYLKTTETDQSIQSCIIVVAHASKGIAATAIALLADTSCRSLNLPPSTTIGCSRLVLLISGDPLRYALLLPVARHICRMAANITSAVSPPAPETRPW